MNGNHGTTPAAGGGGNPSTQPRLQLPFSCCSSTPTAHAIQWSN